jgi:hypothetical protein
LLEGHSCKSVDGRPITNKECFYLMMLISFSPFLARIDLYYKVCSIKDSMMD